ncbi:membrane bound O-acyl transferase family-domain-containing protein [Stachybotrys elegans]|uniref:Membrane bound O-acyl transferase family-domain-containing protein n=1 Tax=Stachybotrys elegans TaxID=80388 RepID=A0A8K0STP5_9HYPO|nr:membrane bound O-acyl transferase family-domain-containing protein [Stachybotrys elegans]
MEQYISNLCLANGRPHWAATAASLLWVQLLSASDLLLALRVDPSQLSPQGTKERGPLRDGASAVGLLWNMRRVGTRWQAKNIPSAAAQQRQTRAGFVFRRVAMTLVAYLFIEVVVSQPPPDPNLVHPDKATLFSLRSLTLEDVIFRVALTISYWVITGVINLFMTNTVVVVAVILGLLDPAHCPPLYGSFLEAFTVRRFWGVSWHQMFRTFLMGHADLVVDNTLPFLPRHSLISRYARLVIAFFISGAIHYRADQLQGVSHKDNGAVAFFLLQALVIMVEDAVEPMVTRVLPAPLRRVLGYVWVLSFLVWASPIWIYSTSRLGIDSTALLPVRIVEPWMSKAGNLKLLL